MAGTLGLSCTSGIFVVALLQLYVSLVSGQKPEIVNNIYPDVQRVGGTARLNCTVARLGQNSVQWSFKGKQGDEVISINERIQVINIRKGSIPNYEVIRKTDSSADRTTFMLVINRLLPDFTGEYVCTIMVTNDQFTMWTSKSAFLQVQYAPVIHPGSTDTVKQIHRGHNASITCDAMGVPTPNITWVRSDGKLLPNGNAIYRGRTLPIKVADVKFSGVYRCVADNQIKPPAESLTQVYVYQAPVVRVVQDSVGQYANGMLDAKLDCIVQGYPQPTVYWGYYKGDTFVKALDQDKYETTKQATDYQNLYNGEQWYTLLIRFVQAGDFRDYLCVAENSEGRGQRKVTLFSTYDCQGPLCYSIDPENRGGGALPRLSPVLLALWLLTTLCLS
ncbi:protein amalgam [Aplysia californica]|uniref:Protein amalgam n=1 Tax=Aplysia californica TaxID=6500 RepID=A0ABM1AF36_APLCA|nr:protein amalgam [Aplysia californica]